jgi:hypothetical protein
MNKIETKLLLCLSDPELTDSDFKELLDLLYRRDFKDLIEAADHLRHVSRECLKKITHSRVPDDFVSYVQTMLQAKTNILPTAAVRLILSELRDEPVPNRKWTIRAGLEYALRSASEEEVLAAVQRVIEKYPLMMKKHAWSLEKREN